MGNSDSVAAAPRSQLRSRSGASAKNGRSWSRVGARFFFPLRNSSAFFFIRSVNKMKKREDEKARALTEMVNNRISLFRKKSNDNCCLIFKKEEFYPYLNRLDARAFCAHVTSGPLEHVFLSSRIITRPHLSRLRNTSLATSTFLKCNQNLLQFP